MNKIKELTEIEYDDYVYDLTTDNHHFAAGVGNMIVHNTDSVFACFRFREKKEELDRKESLKLFNKIIDFGKMLLEPFFLPKDKLLFVKYYDEYYGTKLTEMTLPKYPDCIDPPDDIKIIQPSEDRIKQLLKEYLYENYLAWLWTLQEIINRSFDNLEIKLFDWANYILKKHKFTYNNLKDNRKDEVINPLIEKLETFYKFNEKLLWTDSKTDRIEEFITLLQKIFDGELDKTKTELNKLVKEFLNIKLKQEWIDAESVHDVKETKEKKKLKREHKYNDKTLYELLEVFIVDRLKLNFNKYKTNHINKLNDFINNNLKEYIIYPYWDIINEEKIYRVKIYNKSEPIIDKRTLDFSIELGELSGELVKSRLPFPHDLEYEKTFWPFMILTKKRYVGNKYENDNNKFKQDFMGIVLKRRDNSPIVKEICNGIIDNLINKRDQDGAKKFVENCLINMFENKYDIKYFLQSRTLKSKESYKDWTRIAHVFLADKICNREGSQYESGNRIEFAVVKVYNPENIKLLQGEIIDTPQYIKDNNIEIDYNFYMKNQIMNPALQFLKVVDKNAEQIFTNIEAKYNKPEIKKSRAKKSVQSSICEDQLSVNIILKKKNIIDTDSDNIEIEKPKKIRKTKIADTEKKPRKTKIVTEEQTKIVTEEQTKIVTEKPKKIRKPKIVINTDSDNIESENISKIKKNLEKKIENIEDKSEKILKDKSEKKIKKKKELKDIIV